MRLRPRALGLALALGVIALAGPGAASSVPRDVSGMVLQLADLPDGFAVTLRRDRPNPTVVRETGVGLALLRSWGRKGGYEAVYDRPVDPGSPPAGAASVVASVSTYRSAAGLRRAFAASASRIDGAATPRNRPRKVGRLGDATRMWEAQFGQDGVSVVLYTILWRDRGVLAYVSVAGVAGRLKPAQALALARRQQARIATGGPATGPGLVA